MAERKRAFFVVDYESDGYVLFRINLKDLFDSHAVAPRPALEMVPLPSPVASFKSEVFRGDIAFAISGTTIVGLDLYRTLSYDTKDQSTRYGPGTAAPKSAALLLPVGPDDIYALSIFPSLELRQARPHLEALSPSAGLSWRALPASPLELQRPMYLGLCCTITTCFTMGGRLWLSARGQGQGTYSLETAGARRTWRKEGPWQLPVQGLPAVYVPELGRLLAFCPERHCLCACDMDARPPVVREVWEETWPPECINMGYCMLENSASLVYLGSGRLCITILVSDLVATNALCVQAVHLQLHRQQQRVDMVKRRIRCYTLPKQASRGYVLQPWNATS